MNGSGTKEIYTDFFRYNESDKVWWTVKGELVDDVFYAYKGEHYFSFDKKKIYNLFQDYPQNLTKQQKEIFDKENPFWKEFFNQNGKSKDS